MSLKLQIILKLIKNIFKSIVFVLKEDPLTMGDALVVSIQINIERPTNNG